MKDRRPEGPARLFRIGYVPILTVGPLFGVLLGVPLGLSPFYPDPRGFFGPYFWIALPWYAACAAAPGFVAGLLLRREALRRHAPVRWWVRASLALGLLAGLAAAWGTSLMVLFGPPALASITATLVYWVRFERVVGPGRLASVGR